MKKKLVVNANVPFSGPHNPVTLIHDDTHQISVKSRAIFFQSNVEKAVPE